MPKSSKSRKNLIEEWYMKLPKREHFDKIGQQIFCQPCGKAVTCSQFSHLKQHISTQLHKENAESFEKRKERQEFLQDSSSKNLFYEELAKTLVATGISWSKLSNNNFRNFLAKHIGKHIPDESTLRKNYLHGLYIKAVENIRNEIGAEPVWIGVDETTDPCGRYIANIFVGALRKSVPSPPHLLALKQLPSTNNATVTQLVLDSLSLLWPGCSQSDIDKKFLLFLTDGVSYMIKAGKNLKRTYPKLLHVTCVAHGLHLVAEEVRNNFNDVDKLIASVKAVFRKAPSRTLLFKRMNPELPLPPRPVVTRWGTWIEAAEYLAKNFEEVKSVVDLFETSDAKVVENVQLYFSNKTIKQDLAYLSTHFTFLLYQVKKIQERSLQLTDSFSILEEVDEKLKAATGVTGEAIYGKFVRVTEKNPDLALIKTIGNILTNRETTELTGVLADFEPSRFSAFMYAPITTVENERGFSMQNALLSQVRRRLTVEHLEMEMICHFEFNECEEEIDIN